MQPELSYQDNPTCAVDENQRILLPCRNPPLPYLPVQRKRALTLPLPVVLGPDTQSKQSTSSQTQCTLLSRLPPELRRPIYEEILGNRTIHIEIKFLERLKEWRWWHCVCDREPDRKWWRDRCQPRFVDWGRACKVSSEKRRMEVDTSIIFTCRQA